MAKNVFKNHTDKVLRGVVLRHIDSNKIAVEEACRILANKEAPAELKDEDFVENTYRNRYLDLEISGKDLNELVRNFKSAIEEVLPDNQNKVGSLSIELEVSGYDTAENMLGYYEQVPLDESEVVALKSHNERVQELYADRDLISAEYHQHENRLAKEKEVKRKSNIEKQIAALQAQL